VLDTIGELAGLYAAADVAVVGGSFSGHGGHNPLEPARWGVPVVMGPSRENVRDAWDRLEGSGGAEAAADEATLERTLVGLIEDPAERARRGAALRAALEGRAPVSERIVAALDARGILGSRG
jgi:3-deoxy-D-manno-octulosonic-acid transferase